MEETAIPTIDDIEAEQDRRICERYQGSQMRSEPGDAEAYYAACRRKGTRMRRKLEQLQACGRSFKPDESELQDLQARINSGRDRCAVASGNRLLPESTAAPMLPALEAPAPHPSAIVEQYEEEAPVVPMPARREGPLTPRDRDELQSQLRRIRENQPAPTNYDFNNETPAPVDDSIFGSLNRRRR